MDVGGKVEGGQAGTGDTEREEDIKAKRENQKEKAKIYN